LLLVPSVPVASRDRAAVASVANRDSPVVHVHRAAKVALPVAMAHPAPMVRLVVQPVAQKVRVQVAARDEMIVHRHAGPMTVRPVAREQAKVHDLVIRQHRVRCLPVVKHGRKWTRPAVAAMVLAPEVVPRPSLPAALQPMLQWHRQEIRLHASRRNLSLRSRRSAKRPWPAAIRWEVSLN
jgi:hypothetical protein